MKYMYVLVVLLSHSFVTHDLFFNSEKRNQETASGNVGLIIAVGFISNSCAATQ